MSKSEIYSEIYIDKNGARWGRIGNRGKLVLLDDPTVIIEMPPRNIRFTVIESYHDVINWINEYYYNSLPTNLVNNIPLDPDQYYHDALGRYCVENE